MKIRRESWPLLLVGIVAVPATIVAGLFSYVTLTTRPLHPDPEKVSMVARSAPPSAWAGAVAEGRRVARAGLVQQNLPGLSVAVGTGGSVVWAEGFGWANLEHQTPVAPETRFRTGDVSKALTSAAVGLLVEKQALNLDAEIQTYVPDYPKKQWPVTLRQLMAQVGGLGDDPGDEASLAPCEQTLEGLSLFADHSLSFEPGTKLRRSSYSYILVSAAIEAAARARFVRFMRAQVFEPLGMAGTLPDSASEEIANRAAFYFPRFGGDTRYGPEDAREGDHSCYAGAGAFLSTPSDLVRFGMGIGSGTLLRPSTVEMLQTTQRLTSGEETGYGLGWTIETVQLAGSPARMVGHGTKPDFIGTTASLAAFPERGLAVAVMSNTSFADTKSIALGIAQAFASAAK